MFELSHHIIRVIQFTCILCALALAQVASAAKDKTIILEFAGLDPTEVLTIKLDNGKKLQTASGGADSGAQCGNSEEIIIVDKNIDAITPRLQEAVVKGRVFDHVIVYQGNSQTFLENVLITSYSVSGSAIGTPVESMSLVFSDIRKRGR